MKLIIDENLPTRLVAWFAAQGCQAKHVFELELKGAPDGQVWSYALETGACVVSRDDDFLQIARGSPSGCAIKLTIGNCTTRELLAWLEQVWPTVSARVQSGERAIEV